MFTVWRFTNTCIADHRKVISGPFARLRNYLWWRKHNKCDEVV